ncbi:hypothetical protein DUI87_14431 [Hirundo rustica rustica]|uniref:Uncharacterized protein n=1 Tax=Hirundo rustica rustica TaxID=333673 RepID=A0A3M0K6M9_HIRRU|nr:hypothetical protein DUI87_14431 [Hirundo rustica rustica]
MEALRGPDCEKSFVYCSSYPHIRGPMLGRALVTHIPRDPDWEDTWLVVFMSSWIPTGTWMNAGAGTSTGTLFDIKNLWGIAELTLQPKKSHELCPVFMSGGINQHRLIMEIFSYLNNSHVYPIRTPKLEENIQEDLGVLGPPKPRDMAMIL